MNKRFSILLTTVMLVAMLVFVCTGCTSIKQPEVSNDRIQLSPVQLNNSSLDFNSIYRQEQEYYNDNSIDDSEKVTVIVSIDGTSLYEGFVSQSKYGTLGSYAASEQGKNIITYAQERISAIKNAFNENNISYTNGFDFTTLDSAFSVEVRYGDVNKIRNINGIDNVFVCPTYQLYDADITAINEAIANKNGMTVNSTKYKGEGMLVAVVDSGVEITHDAFNMELSELNITKEQVAEILPSTLANQYTVDDVYYSTKIPFHFNYNQSISGCTDLNGHGTHVAGIAVGKSDVIESCAPYAQLAAMRVGNSKGSASMDVIMAAINDCAILGTDVINLSMGVPSGFSYEIYESNKYYTEIFDNLDQLGITMVVSAGNEGSTVDTMQPGVDKTLITESSTVGSPASYNSTLSIASFDAAYKQYFTINGKEVIYNNGVDKDSNELNFEASILNGQDSLTCEIVSIPAAGKEADYIGIDVENKIALVQRGDISFAEKIEIAQKHGAKACIIYNNGIDNFKIQIDRELNIPFCSITNAEGLKIVNELKENAVSMVINKDNGHYTVSSFSSWGGGSMLELNVDLASFGGDIVSSYIGNIYVYMSGTSMSSPSVTSIMTSTKQYLKEQYPEYTTKEIHDLAIRLLMSTAVVAENADKVAYSPRQQGAGMASLEAAISSHAYLSVNGTNRVKLSLGHDNEKTGIYTLKFNLVNFGENTLSYEFNPTVLTADYDKETLLQIPYALNPNYNVTVNNGTYDNGIVTVEGNTTATIKVVINLSDADKEYLNTFKNGMFVEGFMELVSVENEPTLSIPFLSFYGDWTDAQVIDNSIYGEDAPFLSGLSINGTVVPLFDTPKIKIPIGTYGLWTVPIGYETPVTDESYIALSQQEDASNMLTSITLTMLRKAKKVDIIIKDSITGMEYFHKYSLGLRSTYINNSGYVVTAEFPFNIMAKEFAFSNNQQLECEIIAELDYEGRNQIQTISLPIFCDFEEPTLTKAEIVKSEGKTLLEMDIFDNHYLQSFFVAYSVDNGTNIKNAINYAIPVYNWVKGADNHYSLDITSYVKDIAGDFYIYLQDYAFNTSSYNLGKANVIFGEQTEESNIVSANGYDYNLNEYIDTPIDMVYTSSYGNGDNLILNNNTYNVTSTNEEDWYVVEDGTLVEYNGPMGDIVIPGDLGITTIGRYLFARNANITGITIPKSVTEIREYAFWLCTNLKYVTFEKGATLNKIGACAFSACMGMETINLQDITINELCGFAFFSCQSLTEVTLPEGEITLSGSNVFGGMKRLEKFTCYADLRSLDGGIAIMENVREIYIYGDILEAHGEFFPAINNCRVLELHGNIGNIGTNTLKSTIKDVFFNYAPFLTGTLDIYGDVDKLNAIAFSGLGVDKIVFHGNVGEVSQFAFGGNEKVKQFSVSEDNEYMHVDSNTGIMYNKDETKMFTPSNWDYDGEIVIPDTVTGGNALGASRYCVTIAAVVYDNAGNIRSGYNYTYLNVDKPLLKKITLGKNITTLPAAAFKGFSSLTEIVGLENITEMGGEELYLNCRSLTSFYIAPTCKKLIRTFYNCISLKSINIPETVTDISSAFIGCINLEEVTGMEGVNTTIMAFQNCYSLKSIDQPDTWMLMGEYKNCYNLETINFMGEIGEIYFDSLMNCKSLKSIELPGCYYLEDYAFYGCENLETAVFSEEMEMYSYVFYGCKSLKTFDFVNTEFYYMGEYAFANSGLEEIILPADLCNIQNVFYGCYNVKKIEIAEDDSNYTTIDNVVYTKDKTAVLWYAAQKDATSFVMPETVKEIDNRAFMHASKLESIDLGNVNYIGSMAFAYSGIKSVELNGVEYIGSYAFAYCDNLRLVNIDKNTFEFDIPFTFAGSPVEINFEEGNDSFVFENGYIYNSDKTVLYKAETNESVVTIPEGVKKIAAFAFTNNTAITKVILPSTLVSVGANAFMGCTSLNEIEFRSEKAPQLEGIIEEGHNQVYANFKCHIEDVNGNYIKVICPDDASYKTYIWRLYFGL